MVGDRFSALPLALPARGRLRIRLGIGGKNGDRRWHVGIEEVWLSGGFRQPLAPRPEHQPLPGQGFLLQAVLRALEFRGGGDELVALSLAIADSLPRRTERLLAGGPIIRDGVDELGQTKIGVSDRA